MLFDYHIPIHRGPQEYAALITQRNGTQYLLPIRVCLIGCSPLTPARYSTVKARAGWRVKVRYCDNPALPELAEQLLEKFRRSPLLCCEDAVRVGSADDRILWFPRRYKDVWTLCPKMPLGAQLDQAVVQACERFSSLSILAERILETALRVAWKDQTPQQPFEVISLESFNLYSASAATAAAAAFDNVAGTRSAREKPIDVSEIGTDIAETELVLDEADDIAEDEIDGVSETKHQQPSSALLVNGKPSCELFQHCNLPQAPDSRYCVPHSLSITNIVLRRLPPSLLDNVFELRTKDLEQHQITQLRELRSLYDRRAATTWLIDCEYMALVGKVPLVLTISIRTITGRSLLNETIDYGSLSYEGMLQAIRPALNKSTATPKGKAFSEKFLKSLFNKHYHSERTWGKRPSEIRNMILALGYRSDTHVLMSWWATQDMQIFQRLVNGSDAILVEAVQAEQKYKLGTLLRQMLPRGFPSMKLSIVHRSICRQTAVRGEDYHLADFDTLALAEVVREMVKACVQ